MRRHTYALRRISHREYRGKSHNAVEKMSQPHILVRAVLIVVEIHGRYAKRWKAENLDKRGNRDCSPARSFLHDRPMPYRIYGCNDLLGNRIVQWRPVGIRTSAADHFDNPSVFGAHGIERSDCDKQYGHAK